MANELTIDYPTGATLYVLLFDATGQIWNGAAFAAPGSASWTDYDIAMTEVATSTGVYQASMPAAAAGVYGWVVRKQAGGSPAVGDIAVGSGTIAWSGTAEIVPLAPTVAGRTLDVSATGEAGVDLDNIKQATAPTTLTNITVPTVTTTGTASAVTAISAGGITAASIADAAIDNATFAADVGSTAYATNIIGLAVRKALDEIKLDHLVAVADSDDPVDNSIVAKLAASDGDWSGYALATDSLEAIRDKLTDIETDTAEIGVAGAGLTVLATASALTSTNTTVDDIFDDLGDVRSVVDDILQDTGTTGVVLADDAITAAKIAADAIGASELAATAAAEIAAAVLAGGAGTYSYSNTVDDGSGNLLDGVYVQLSTNVGFTNIVNATHTNVLGAFTVYSDTAGTHYLRLQLSGYEFAIQTVTTA